MGRNPWYRREWTSANATGKIYTVSVLFLGYGLELSAPESAGHVGVLAPSRASLFAARYYATPHLGADPFDTTNGVRSFERFSEAAAWLVGIHDAKSEWLNPARSEAPEG
jgi:hypothetical protein